MKRFLKADDRVNELWSLVLYTPLYLKLLLSAIELDIFSAVEKNDTAEEIAQQCASHVKNTERLLDALVSLNLIEKKDGRYHNTSLASKHLVKGQELYLGEYFQKYSDPSGFRKLDVVKYVKEGPDPENVNRQGLDAHEKFGDYSQQIKITQKSGRAAEVAEIIADLPEFAKAKKILDLGGGPGLMAMAILERHPDLKATIFETPIVAKSIEESMIEYDMTHRIDILTGDYTKDSIGEKYDLVFTIGTLNFVRHDLDQVIKKIYDSLNPGGVFISFAEGVNTENTQPKEMVVSWLSTLLQGFDFLFSRGEISDAMIRQGFKSVDKQTVNMIMGEMDVDIARK